ncbi:Uncharacterized protein conserved in bacteria [Serratia odorifera]|uniref:Uncharacterized protein conserved in bacteria n=1 Tax=Serratia odorifera TaxID=618 RepID=A0A3S4HRR3_SEROD|nr:hypothetical protein [Serratia odorifera]VDZ62888.1 Uncharacterized protein conserved in bacteria [Serratia odorifera]
MSNPSPMEALRRPHHNQWYHETQSSVRGDSPLQPQAAGVRDRFLLGLGEFADAALNNALIARAPVFSASLDSCRVLFPERVTLSRYVTLSPYDRLCTALTVAQVTGVQALCSHYAARLAPLDSPDASRESNIRLAQITQYARQLATHPTLICHKAVQQLSEVGLSTADIISFTQIIGFVSYQARVVAGVAALAGRPTALVPGFPSINDCLGCGVQPRVVKLAAPLTAGRCRRSQCRATGRAGPKPPECTWRALLPTAGTRRRRAARAQRGVQYHQPIWLWTFATVEGTQRAGHLAHQR